MFFLLLFSEALALSIKSSIDVFFPKKPILKRIQKFLAIPLFASITWLLYQNKVKSFSAYPLNEMLIAGALFLFIVIPKPRFIAHSFIFKFIKTLCYLVLFISASFIFGLTQYHKLTKGKPFAVVKITGEKEQTTISLLRNFEESKKVVNTYKIILEDIEGSKLCEEYVYGDLIGIRVKTLSFASFLNRLGFDNCYKIDMIYNGFTEKSSYSMLPIQTISFHSENVADSLFDRMFHRYWSSNFYKTGKNPLIKSAALQSQYFPLVSPDKTPFIGNFELVLYSTGIGGKALN